VTDGDALRINPEPLAVVSDRGSVAATARMALSFTREQRKMAWMACGGDPQVWEDEHPDRTAESVSEMSWSELHQELSQRRLPIPITTEAMRSALVRALIAERNTILAIRAER
jgi:hypothetical protein